jgi:hypothetical protein
VLTGEQDAGHGTPDERAARGAKLLDEKRPGWADRIDPETFDVRSVWHCAACQATGDAWFSEAMGILLGPDNTAVKRYLHGFSINDRVDSEALQAAWLAEIAKRKTVPDVSVP